MHFAQSAESFKNGIWKEASWQYIPIIFKWMILKCAKWVLSTNNYHTSQGFLLYICICMFCSLKVCKPIYKRTYYQANNKKLLIFSFIHTVVTIKALESEVPHYFSIATVKIMISISAFMPIIYFLWRQPCWRSDWAVLAYIIIQLKPLAWVRNADQAKWNILLKNISTSPLWNWRWNYNFIYLALVIMTLCRRNIPEQEYT